MPGDARREHAVHGLSGTPKRSTFSLRRAVAADAEAIAAVNTAAARAGWADFVDPDRLGRFEAPVERWQARLEEAGARGPVLVATEGRRIVGFVSLRIPSEGDGGGAVGEIAALYTDPAVWGRGAGRALLDAALPELRAVACSAAVLWTEERNRRPRAIYERLGWRADGAVRERAFLGLTIRELRYRLELAEPRGA